MTNRFCILVCENFKKELEKVIASEQFKDESTGTFPARCGRPQMGWNEVNAIAQNLGEFDRVLVLGGCCIAGLTVTPSSESKSFVFHRKENCSYLLADPFLVDTYIRNGGYLMTPTWLENWKTHVDEWGFEKKRAQGFIRESINKLVLLDTGVNMESPGLLKEMAEYLNLPYEMVPVETGFFSLFLEKTIYKWRLKIQQEKSDRVESEFQKQLAEHSMVFDMICKSSTSVNETEVISHIIDMVSMLFSPGVLHYLPVHNGNPGQLQQVPCIAEENKTIQNHLMELGEPYGNTSSGKGFWVQIRQENETLGIIEIDDILFIEYRDHYLNLTLSIVNVWALSIINARRYQYISDQKEVLCQNIKQLELTKIKLHIAKEKAEAANRAKSVFLANMSHELRTPLNHIIGFTELVVDKTVGELNEAQKEYLNDVLTSGRHLFSLINDILDLSSVEAGKMKLELSAVNLKALLENSLVMIREKTMKHGIRLSAHIDGIPPTVTADERKLKQIMHNLLSNAVKFTPHGGEIHLTADLADGAWLLADSREEKASEKKINAMRDQLYPSQKVVRISVADTGIGIKPEDLPILFSPFEQAENTASRRFQGTGLGLSLTRGLVELHGGVIWSESAGEGQGSTFTFVIPAGKEI